MAATWSVAGSIRVTVPSSLLAEESIGLLVAGERVEHGCEVGGIGGHGRPVVAERAVAELEGAVRWWLGGHV